MMGLRIICALALGLVPAMAQAQAAPDGATIYRQRCQICHGAAGAKPSPLGPNLAGVIGRKAASKPFAYSAALKASKLVWTRSTLDQYLAGPAKLVPGTRMAVALSDAQQRAAVVGYLAKTK